MHPPPRSSGRDTLRSVSSSSEAAARRIATASSKDMSSTLTWKGFGHGLPSASMALATHCAASVGSAKGASFCRITTRGMASCCTLFLERFAKADCTLLPACSAFTSSVSCSCISWFSCLACDLSSISCSFASNSSRGTASSPVACSLGYACRGATLLSPLPLPRRSARILSSWSVRIRLPDTYSSRMRWNEFSPLPKVRSTVRSHPSCWMPVSLLVRRCFRSFMV